MLLRGVEKRFGDVVAVGSISLTVRQGETVALLGPSGAGKSTMLRLMAGEIEPTSGVIELSGRELANLAPGRELASLVGMIHQQFDLVPNLSALQNVLAGRLGEWGFFRSLVSLAAPLEREVAMAALRRLGVEDRAGLRAGRLSGGEQQRVAIARVLVQGPALILADEPVASLDPARAEEVLDLLVGLVERDGRTLVASMHSVVMARQRFGRLIGLRNGELSFDLPAQEVTDGMLESLYALEGLRAET
ncbi:MAG: ATP-binding cassette domain-containing protein [Chloroflexi bacterium]|nr:ATP-binding cassette domain-containing protein [Chloroflexota bacterium]